MSVNVSNMYGNTFMNLFLLGLVEGPGNVMGVVMANKIGRRWTHFILLFVNAILFAAIIPVAMMPKIYSWVTPVTSFLCMWIKMNISGSFVVAYVQVSHIVYID